MILIAEVGATKGDWTLFEGSDVHRFETPGYSPLRGETELHFPFQPGLEKATAGRQPWRIYYYGTGVINEESTTSLQNYFSSRFPGVQAEFHSDLMAIAHSGCGENQGVVAILGTGSNAGFYNGKSIERQIPAMGYLLGDEGGGYSIGRSFLRGYFRQQLPSRLQLAFENAFGRSGAANWLSHIYRHQDPKSHIAQMANFVLMHASNPYCESLLLNQFREFAEVYLSPYKGKGPVHFGGSIAFHAKHLLSQVLMEKSFEPGEIMARPMDGLIAYHQRKHYGL